ncbi:Alpha-adducin, partial [Linnemannia elongata]
MPIPKAELHLHIEGTLEPELAFDLAARNRVELPYVDVDELRKAYDFEDLQSFLNLYYELMAVLRTERDFEDLADAYLARAAAQGVRHAEIFFDPQAHIARGVEMGTVIEGLWRALGSSERNHGISTRLILCFLRDESAGSALKTLEAARPYLDRITGVGLDSAEVGHPPAKFREVRGGATRVLRVVDTLADYPLPAMLDAGLLCTVNSDDPAYFGGYADDNFEAVRKTLGLTEDCIRKLARNSFLASFLEDDEERRARYLAE